MFSVFLFFCFFVIYSYLWSILWKDECSRSCPELRVIASKVGVQPPTWYRSPVILATRVGGVAGVVAVAGVGRVMVTVTGELGWGQ